MSLLQIVGMLAAGTECHLPLLLGRRSDFDIQTILLQGLAIKAGLLRNPQNVQRSLLPPTCRLRWRRTLEQPYGLGPLPAVAARSIPYGGGLEA